MTLHRPFATALVLAMTLTAGCSGNAKADAAEPATERKLENPNRGDNLLLVARTNSGTIATSNAGVTILTLEDIDTITWFSDRPAHDAGVSTAKSALEAFGWHKNGDDLGTPPNAALVATEYGDDTPVVQIINASLADGNLELEVVFVGAPPATHDRLTDIELFIDDAGPRSSGIVEGSPWEGGPLVVRDSEGWTYQIVSVSPATYQPSVGASVTFEPVAGFLRDYASQVSPG